MEVDLVSSGISEEDSFQLQNYTNDNSNFEGERCGICMDIIIDRGVLDCCQHWFCFVCIDNWATITNLCPLCQSEFQLITCVPVYDTIGSNKVDEDSFSRDDDWCIEGKSNTLSFPSYYIDENAVICLDEDGCKIRTGSATIEGDSNLDTSIACDSCDIWYHALCVGFDPEGTSEDTWLCPRCVNNELPQKSDVISIQRTNNQCGSENANGECLAEAAFSGKVSVSVADAGETAVVISMVDGNQYTEGLSEDFLSTFEVDKAHKNQTLNPDSSNLKVETASSERTNIQSGLEAQELKLSLSHDTSSSLPSNSLIVGQLKTSCPGKALNEPSTSNGVRISLRKSFHEFCSTNKLSESDSSMGLHLGLSVGSFLSVDGMNNDGTEDQVTGDVQQQNLSEESLSKADEILPDAKEDASRIIGVKRTHADCSEDVHMSAEDKETKAKNEPEVLAKKIKHEVKIQTTPSEDEANASTADDPQKCPSRISVSKNDKLKHCPEKEDVTFDILGIVQGTGHRPSKGLASRNSADKTSKEGDNLAGLRVKKILRRPADDKESSMVVQELRKRIREAVRNKSSKDIGENLFDPKLLAAFRAAIAGPKTEPVRNLSPSAVKVKKSMLQKGKIRENLTKKIYGNSNGRRKRAWDRDCEVEFWKHRSMRATKPEKIETLKSVLDLLRKNSGSAEIETASEGQATNPILSRLYLADTSVFPRKEDIKPLSALKATGNSEQNKEVSSVKNSSNPSLDNCIVKIIESNKLSSKVGVPSPDDKGSKTNVPSSKVNAASSKLHPHRRPGGSSASPSGDFKVKSQKEMGVKSDDVKIDKRKWALEVLARKSALEVKPAMHEKQEDNAVLKGNYPLLAQLPADMRPVLAPSRHNKIPVSVRQTQLYRLTEHFLRKANLPVIRRTAETELAVADAINIEKEVADRSNSKVVYMNLCSQEILHRSDNSKSIKAPESNSSPQSAVPVDGSEQATEDLSTDPVVLEALRAAGLLSDSPPNSPHHKMEVTGEVDDSSLKINEEGPDNVFEIDSHPEVDIYGDFEYDLEDEDYIGASVLKAKLQPEETVSKVKVLFSTLNSESSNNALDLESYGRLGNVEVPKDSTSLLKSHTDVAIGSSTVESGTVKSCLPPESLPVEEGEELSVAECEELYGPDKEPLINKFPEGASQNGLVAADPSVNKDAGNNENYVSNHNASGGVNSPDDSQTGDNVPRKEKKSNTDANKQCDGVNSVTKKVEAYVKEHIRPLCKSGVITAEQYRWAVAKTTDKVMKYHLNAKSANFLIKEGEKVKKLAEQYVEAAQQGKM